MYEKSLCLWSIFEIVKINTGKNKGKLQYRLKFSKYFVGSLSVPKSKELHDYINNKSYEATLSLKYFEEHKHYSKLTVKKDS